MNTTSILAEIPEELGEAAIAFLKSHPDYDYDRMMTTALAMFLTQNGSSDSSEASQHYRRAARIYLDTLFKHAV